MFPIRSLTVAVAGTVAVVFCAGVTAGQDRVAAARNVRCVFEVAAASTWSTAGVPAAAVKPAKLVLVFDSIDTDEGTARLKSGSVGTEVTARCTRRRSSTRTKAAAS